VSSHHSGRVFRNRISATSIASLCDVITTVKKLTTNVQYGKNGSKYGGHDFTVGIEVLII